MAIILNVSNLCSIRLAQSAGSAPAALFSSSAPLALHYLCSRQTPVRPTWSRSSSRLCAGTVLSEVIDHTATWHPARVFSGLYAGLSLNQGVASNISMVPSHDSLHHPCAQRCTAELWTCGWRQSKLQGAALVVSSRLGPGTCVAWFFDDFSTVSTCFYRTTRCMPTVPIRSYKATADIPL